MNTKLQVTVFLNAADMSGDVPLHEIIVRRLLHLHIAGATVLRGIMGYGGHGQVHRKRLLGVSDDQPIVIISIDEQSKIQDVLPELRKLAPDALITVGAVEAF